jgi:hypothetical protein
LWCSALPGGEIDAAVFAENGLRTPIFKIGILNQHVKLAFKTDTQTPA